MDYVIANIGYFLEIWMIQIYVELVWKQKICFQKFSCALFVINGIILTGINLRLIPAFFVLFVHLMLYCYLWKHFKGNIKEKFARTCAVFVLAWGTEVFAEIIVAFFRKNISEEISKFIIMNIVSFSIANIVKFITKNKKKKMFSDMDYKLQLSSVMLCMIPVSLTVVDYFCDHKTRVWYDVLIIIFFVIVISYLKRIQKVEFEIKQKEMELNINRIYGALYEDVINDIRRKQHNYKEQIAAIYSSHKMADSKDELINQQKQYCDMLLDDSKYDSVLTSCNEPVLAGFIYYKCLDCLKRNVKVDFKISVNEWKSELKLHELIEILGVLFNNSFEYLKENDIAEKTVFFSLVESENKYTVVMANEIAEDSKIEFTNMFDMGYSTKGVGRGLGLPRVKQICDSYGAEIKVTIEHKESRRIQFEISVLKCVI